MARACSKSSTVPSAAVALSVERTRRYPSYRDKICPVGGNQRLTAIGKDQDEIQHPFAIYRPLRTSSSLSSKG